MTIRHLRDAEVAAVQQRFAGNLVGHQLQEIEWRESDCLFSFADTDFRLLVTCRWRIVSDGRLAFAASDDRQQFGLPAPVDAAFESRRLLTGKTVEGIAIRAETADLTISFQSGVRLEIWSDSSGYEAWTIWDGERFQVVARGGGRLAIWNCDA